jgi:hypothetical protein
VKLVVRVILFYCCISLFSGDLISLAIKVKETYALDIEKEKNEESKEESNRELEEKYTEHHTQFTITLFDYVPENGFRIDSEKLISQIHQEISTPPPNC